MTETNKQSKPTLQPLPFPSCPNGGCGWYAMSNLFNIDFRKVSESGVEFGELSGVLWESEKVYINTLLASYKPLKPNFLTQLLKSIKNPPNVKFYTPLIFNVKTQRGRHCVAALKKGNSNQLIIIDPQHQNPTSTTTTQYFKKNQVFKIGVFMGGVGMMVSLGEEGVSHIIK